MIYGATNGVKGLYTYPSANTNQFGDGWAVVSNLDLQAIKLYCTPDYNTDYPKHVWSGTFTNCSELLASSEYDEAVATFDHIVITMFTFANGTTNWWRLGPTRAQLDAEYAEYKAAAAYLLTQYNNSGKSFTLSTWEGDWALLDSFDVETRNDRKMVDFYAEFLATRQKAVQDARKENPHYNVRVRNAFEVNRVLDAKKYPHRQRIVTHIAKLVRPDVVSYSAYDSTIVETGWQADTAAWTAAMNAAFTSAIKIIRRAWPGVPVYLGEFGFPELEIENEHALTHDAQDMIQAVNDIAEELDIEMLLYWQAFDNEAHGTYTYRGYWLMKNDGTTSEAGTKMQELAGG